jgi:hypothetical protein
MSVSTMTPSISPMQRTDMPVDDFVFEFIV